jgi:hypothetical protein
MKGKQVIETVQKRNKKRNWFERKLDEYNHTMELIRTIVPIIMIFLQILILTKLAE